MHVVGDLVGPDRRSDRTVLHQPGQTPAVVDADRLCVQSWKVAHFLRHQGTRAGTIVEIDADPARGAILAFLGAALLGATVRFTDLETGRRTGSPPPDVCVGPTTTLASRSVDPNVSQVVYGDPPTDAAVAHLERGAWSENPTPPPETVDPEGILLNTGEGSHTHRATLAAATETVEREGLAERELIALRAGLDRPGAVVAGLVAPLVLPGTICVPDDSTVCFRVTDGSDGCRHRCRQRPRTRTAGHRPGDRVVTEQTVASRRPPADQYQTVPPSTLMSCAVMCRPEGPAR